MLCKSGGVLTYHCVIPLLYACWLLMEVRISKICDVFNRWLPQSSSKVWTTNFSLEEQVQVFQDLYEPHAFDQKVKNIFLIKRNKYVPSNPKLQIIFVWHFLRTVLERSPQTFVFFHFHHWFFADGSLFYHCHKNSLRDTELINSNIVPWNVFCLVKQHDPKSILQLVNGKKN